MSRSVTHSGRAAALAAGLVMAGCGSDPTILLEVTRSDRGATLAIQVCDTANLCNDFVEVFDQSGPLEKSVGVFVDEDQAPATLRLRFQQGMLDAAHCESIDVSLGEAPLSIGVELFSDGRPVEVSCATDQCTEPADCGAT